MERGGGLMFDPVSDSVCHILGYRVYVISSLKYFAVIFGKYHFQVDKLFCQP